MKKKNCFLFLLGVLVALVSCQQDYDSFSESKELEANGRSITKLETESGFEIRPEFMPLDSVPEWAEQTMTQDEYEIWKTIASKYKVDYSFLNTKYYKINKDNIFNRIKMICNDINNGTIKEAGSKLTVVCSELRSVRGLFNRIERLDNPESGESKSKRFNNLFSSNPVSLDASIIYVYVNSSVGYIMSSSSFIANPAGAKIEGASSLRLEPLSGVFHVVFEGDIVYKDKKYPASVNETFVLN